MKSKLKHINQRIKDGILKEMWVQTKWIYTYAKNYWKAMIIYTLIGLAGTVVGLASSLVSKDLIDVITGHQTGLLVRSFCLFIGLSVGNIFLTQISNYASNLISIKVDNEIKANIFEKMLMTDLEAISSYHTGDLLTRWNADASVISNGILSWIPNLIIYTIKFISAFAIVLYYDPTFAVFAMMGIPVSIIMSRTLLSKMKNNNKRSSEMNARMSGFNQEAFSNIQTLKAFDLLHVYCLKLKNLQKDYLSMKMDFQKLSMVTAIIMSIVGIAVSYSCYGWGIYRVWSGAISYGTMTMFLSLTGTLTATMDALISLVPTTISLTTSAGRIMDILDMPKEDYSKSSEIDEFYKKNITNGVNLIIKDMTYSYNNGNKVFEHANLEAHPHEIIALVGPSGEGKTTMLRILLSLLHPQYGDCKLYGTSNNNLNAGSLNSNNLNTCTLDNSLDFSPATRRLFSYVPQGNTMFSGTIAENMRDVKPDATDDDIISVLKTSCAWDFVCKLPDTINSKVGERGGGFSEGQAQRLSIARALLRKSPILLLDEATSALDVATERIVLKNIMYDDYPRTCIVTTHRPTVLNVCTRVYAIRDKRCVTLDDNEIQELLNDF